MKTKIPTLIALMMLLFACQPKEEQRSKPVDLDAAKTEVKALIDDFDKAIIKSDWDGILKMLSKDGWYSGTDPSEVWNYDQYTVELNKMKSDTTFKVDFVVDKQIIKVDSAGLNALVLEQFVIKQFSEKMTIRNVLHTKKEGNIWKIDFFSMSFIPKNEDIEKINKALE